MKKTLITFIIVLSFSCKENKQVKIENKKADIESTKKGIVKPEKDNVFKLEFEVKLLENDKFRVFYAGNYLEEKLSEKQMVVTSIKGNPEFQKVIIKLPPNILPYKLRVDLGENSIKNETPIEFNSIQLKLNDKTIKISNNILNQFFRPNSYLKKIDNGFERKIIEGKYDPFLVSTPLLNKKIEMELY